MTCRAVTARDEISSGWRMRGNSVAREKAGSDMYMTFMGSWEWMELEDGRRFTD